MSNVNYAEDLLIAKELAKKANVPLDKYLDSVLMHQEYINAQAKARGAESEEKEKIMAYLNSLNGNISADITPADICTAAGVKRKQGTMSYARYQVTQILL